MTKENLLELLSTNERDCETISQKYTSLNLSQNIQALTEKLDQMGWPHTAADKIKELKKLETLNNLINETLTNQTDYKDLIELSEDTAQLESLEQEIRKHIKKTKQCKIQLLLNEEDDNKNCYLDINAGAGGTEAQDWAGMIARMLLRFCEKQNLKTTVIDTQVGEEAGIKSTTIFVEGSFAYGILKSEIGIHRLVRISPFDSNKRRHTSFAAVNLTPETPDITIEIDPKDLRIDTYRAGGAGGQHVNKTDSAVRITHLPTNIVAQCQNERSQLQNKEQAMKILKSRIYQHEKDKREAEAAGIEKKKIEWGSQIRSYVLHPYKMVKDHRTNTESPQPESVLDGELIEFIESYLIAL